jgi:hypothetical protein
LAVGDSNGDGFPDLAIPDSYNNTVQVLINSGSWPASATTAAAPASPVSQRDGTAAVLTDPATLASPLASAAGLAPPPERSVAAGVLFEADPAALDQLLAARGVEGRLALWFGTRRPALDGGGDQVLSDLFPDPFRKRR